MTIAATNSNVAIVTVGGSIQAATREAMDLAGWKQAIPAGRPVALKINLGWDLFIPGSVTSPWVIEGVIQTIRDWTGPIALVESDQVLENIEKAFRKMKLRELCNRYGVEWINLSRLPATQVDVPDGAVFKRLEIPQLLLERTLVTVAVMKTHAKTGLTGAIKNQWGCISKMRHNYHLVLDDALADINSVIRPSFAVMDATIALEGNGPKSGKPRVVNRVLASSDFVALDTTQACLMGLDPMKISHLQRCALRGLGTADEMKISRTGNQEPGLNFHFQPAQHNIVSRMEELLRRSRLRRLVFDTPLFLLMLAGAKLWYFVWFFLVAGRGRWALVLKDPFYGPLWQRVYDNQRSLYPDPAQIQQ